AVAGDDPYRKLGIGELDAGGDRKRAPVDAVEAVGVHVIREAARASDSRYEYELLPRNSQARQKALNGGEHGVVRASRTPLYFLPRNEVFANELHESFDR